MVRHDVVYRELLAIKDRDDDGQVKAEVVVELASNPKHPLHGYFEWDDSKAAHDHRLWQARVLIARVRIVNPDASNPTPIPAFVSLVSDRHDGGGYRSVADVLADPVSRDELERTAIGELAAWTERHRMLTELVAPVKRIIKRSRKKAVA